MESKQRVYRHVLEQMGRGEKMAASMGLYIAIAALVFELISVAAVGVSTGQWAVDLEVIGTAAFGFTIYLAIMQSVLIRAVGRLAAERGTRGPEGPTAESRAAPA